jgi:hypothetical protein
MEFKKERADKLAINNKLKAMGRPDNTALLIFFDDYIAFSRDQDKKEINEFMDSVSSFIKNKYKALFVVGASGKNFWERIL